MGSENSFNVFLSKLKQGEQAAATEVFQRFARQLVDKARAQLDSRLRQKIDPEDVVQSVYRSFFVRYADGRFEFENWDSLWGLLVTITVRKCGRKVEYFRAAARDLNREASPGTQASGANLRFDSTSDEPTPQEAAILAETVENLIRQLHRPRDVAILTLSLQGHTREEVAQQVGCSEHTVRRVLKLVQEQLEEQDADL